MGKNSEIDSLSGLSALIPPLMADVSQPDSFVPSPDVAGWIRETFLSQDSPLYNVEHDHLNSAEIGVLWTNAVNTRQMKAVVGMAETGKPPSSLSKWAKARMEFQSLKWFGGEVDFIITLYAPYFAGSSEIVQCALVEHELYHCGQRYDEFGCPKFRKDGKPVFGIRGHDVEEFVGVVRRYGLGAGETEALAEAFKGTPEVGQADISRMCGTCQKVSR